MFGRKKDKSLKLYKNFYFEGQEVNQPFGKKDRSVPHGAEIESGAALLTTVMGKKTRTGTGRRTILQLSPPGPNRSATGAAREDGVASGSEGPADIIQIVYRVRYTKHGARRNHFKTNTVLKTGLLANVCDIWLIIIKYDNCKIHCLIVTLCGSVHCF